MTTALIADDEPLLRDELARMLQTAWPELRISHCARNGREALAMFEAEPTQICFLDIHMPGLSGIEAAKQLRGRCHIVFVTAYEQYAAQAFEHEAIDYVVKPVVAERLNQTVARLKRRLQEQRMASVPDAWLDSLAQQLQARLPAPASPSNFAPLRWLRASVGQTIKLIDIAQVDYLKSDDKYTVIAWRTDDGRPSEAVIRMPLKDLLAQLDPNSFAQTHRSTVVNLQSVASVVRGENETATVHLKSRPETLAVSRNYGHVFRQM